MGALVAPLNTLAQGIDAGALQQNLQRQIPSTSPLNLPTPTDRYGVCLPDCFRRRPETYKQPQAALPFKRF